MPEGKNVPLHKLKSGQSGKVIEIQGGPGIMNRLSSLGIIPGKRVMKVSSQFWRGPVTVQSGSTRIAIGHGMAHKIIVEPE